MSLLSLKERFPYPNPDGTDFAMGARQVQDLAEAVDAKLNAYRADLDKLRTKQAQVARKTAADIQTFYSGPGSDQGATVWWTDLEYDNIPHEGLWDILTLGTYTDEYPSVWFAQAGLFATSVGAESNAAKCNLELAVSWTDPVSLELVVESYRGEDFLAPGAGGVELTVDACFIVDAPANMFMNFGHLNGTDMTSSNAWLAVTRVKTLPTN